MSEGGTNVFEVLCPHCRTVIWVDGDARGVLKAEKAARRRAESLDDLLAREQRKTEGLATKFEATASLEKLKKDKAKEAFEKAFSGSGEDLPGKD